MSQHLNRIPEQQTSEKFLKYLAASSKLYADAKKIAGLQAVLSVPVPIIFSVIAVLHPPFKVWASAYGFLISLCDVVLFDKLQNDWKKEGAKVQELFDCGLLEMVWHDFKVGDRPMAEKLHRAAERRLNKLPREHKERGWYSPTVGRLPMPLARIACQRTNILWDSELRRLYARGMSGLLFVLALAALVAWMAVNMTAETFILSVATPIFPAVLWLLREIRKQREAAATLDRLMKYAQDFWKDLLGGKLNAEQAAERSRELQDELFTHRHSNQPVFNFVHRLVRRGYERHMDVGAEALVEEALQARGSSKHLWGQ